MPAGDGSSGVLHDVGAMPGDRLHSEDSATGRRNIRYMVRLGNRWAHLDRVICSVKMRQDAKTIGLLHASAPLHPRERGQHDTVDTSLTD